MSTRSEAPHTTRWILVSFAAACTIGLLLSAPAMAGGQVGDGTPGSCYEAALDAKLAGGGVVTFNCGANPHTILITGVKAITQNAEIRGSGVITISGGNATPLFSVSLDRKLILLDLGLTRGHGSYGAVLNFGELHIHGGRLIGNGAMGNGGAIRNWRTLRITNTVIAENHTWYLGGAIYSNLGTVELHATSVYSNSAPEGGGAIYTGSTARLYIFDSQLAGNSARRGDGGALRNLGAATLVNSALSANFALNSHDAGGGGIRNTGSLTLTGVVFQANRAESSLGSGSGGALLNEGGSVEASDVQFLDNHALGVGGTSGGAIVSTGRLSIRGATFAGNRSDNGSAIANFGGVLTLTNAALYSNTAVEGRDHRASTLVSGGNGSSTLVNVTISGNDALDSGGLHLAGGTATVVHTTIAGNRGTGGAGVYAEGGQARLRNSVVADNRPVNCSGAVISDGHNLSSDASCVGWNKPGDQTDKPAQLGPLADNGGPTLTHLPNVGSPLIDGGQCLPDVPTDQRGVARPFGAKCDIGAVEWTRLLAFLPVVRR